MRPFPVLLALCAGTTPAAWSQTNTPPTPLTAAPPVTTVAGAHVAGDNAPTNPTANAAESNDANQPQLLATREGVASEGGRGREAAREERRLQFESRFREMLGGFGITNTTTQDAIIAYVAQEELERNTGAVRDASRKLSIGLRRNSPPERMRELVENYKKAVAAEKVRRLQAQKLLDAKIGFSLDARMEGLLLVSGMLGDSAGSMPLFPMGRGNFGRDGGGRDGGGRDREGGRGGPSSPNREQRGTITGTVEKKDAEWIEVRDEKGDLQRYSPIYKPEIRGLDARGLQLIAQTNVGQRVQIDWFWLEKRRIVNLTVIPAVNSVTPLAALPNINQIAPATPNPAAPAPAIP